MSSPLPKKVLITGAQGALGQFVVRKFQNAGYEVSGVYFPHSIEKSDPAVKWIKLDLSDPQAVKTALSDSEFDILIHCAGGFRYSAADQFTDEDFDFLINVNLKSAFYLVRSILPGMKKRNFGRILFVSSHATLRPSAGMGPYAASKAGLNMLTAALAEETKSYNITVNAILPSIIDTPANRRDMPNGHFEDWVTPEQLAEIFYSLSTSLGQPIHGALLPVTGRV